MVAREQKLGQHADARELSALYTEAGVPIYPRSLGHSYHTLTWRMGIEAREMEDTSETSDPVNEELQGEEPTRNRAVDRFYSDRYDARMNDGFSSPDLTYLEEKCLFWHHHRSDDSGEAGRSRRSLLNGRTSFGPLPPVLGQARAGLGVPTRFPTFRPADGQSQEGQRSSLAQSASSSYSDAHAPRLLIRVHRHLADQHLLGRPSVDDESGAMLTAPVSLAADFYHPLIARPVLSSIVKPLTEVSHETPPVRLQASELHEDLPHEPVTSASRVVPPIPTPPPSEQGTPNATTPQRFALDGSFVNDDEYREGDDLVAQHDPPLMGTIPGQFQTPTHFEPQILTPPTLQVNRNALPETPQRTEHTVLSNVDLEMYSSSSVVALQTSDAREGASELRSHLRSRFATYQRRLDALLVDLDNDAFEECLLDFWDEFLPTTANIHYYDRYTAVPRLSRLEKFLTKPCPKAIGIVQCEIERIRIHPKKKGVNMKGRLFPSYEYRLFIRDRRHSSAVDTSDREPTNEPRKDTVLMTAKNRGKKQHDGHASGSSKKGVNNYFLRIPQQSDVDSHYNAINKTEMDFTKRPNGANHSMVSSSGESANGLLGRLQSNFIGTEFQIFSQSLQKRPARATRRISSPSSDSEIDVDYDSGVSSGDNLSTSSASRRRRRFRRRSSNTILNRSADAVDQPQPIEEGEESPSRSKPLRKTMSMPVLSYGRSSRTSRRAIAHSTDPPESQLYQSVFCEEEEGAITYTANLLGNRPRIMDVCIPKVSPNGVAGAEWMRYLESCGDASSANKMLTHFKQLQQRLDHPNVNADDDGIDRVDDNYVPPDDFGLLALQNRPPWWNIELGAFVLNFGGRVSVASVKNFQLCERSNQDHIMLQFGRIQGRHSFTMDFQHPLTAVQAFAIAISSLQSKISFG